MTDTAGLTSTDIDVYIEQITKAAVLGRSKRRIRLLDHLVRSEFLGQGETLKAYSIGLDVFGKPAEFDPSSNSVVRVEMGRLRSAIAMFEASELANTRLVVDIPVGTYRPVLSLRETPDVMPVQRPAPKRRTPRTVWWGVAALVMLAAVFGWRGVTQSTGQPPAIGVQINQTARASDSNATVQAAMTRALSRAQTIKVLKPGADGAPNANAGFLINVNVVEDAPNRTITTEVSDVKAGLVVWANALTVPDGTKLSDAVENRLARELRVRLFGASKEVLRHQDPETLSPEALFVLSTWVPGVAQSAIEWEKSRIALAQQALAAAPDFGAAHSVLADKLAYLANVYSPASSQDALDAAMFHSNRAMDLTPLDPDVVFNVAQAHWHSGHITQSQALMARVVELDPGHDLARFLSLVIPYSCASVPDDVLGHALAFDANLSGDNPIRWLTLTWIGWLHTHRQEWAKALAAEEAAARIFQVPYSFMRRAMVLNQLNRPEDAAAVIAEQSGNWADFDPAHFITTTIPRLCSETEDNGTFLEPYKALLRTLQ